MLGRGGLGLHGVIMAFILSIQFLSYTYIVNKLSHRSNFEEKWKIPSGMSHAHSNIETCIVEFSKFLVLNVFF